MVLAPGVMMSNASDHCAAFKSLLPPVHDLLPVQETRTRAVQTLAVSMPYQSGLKHQSSSQIDQL
jgi:hypothetical protein